MNSEITLISRELHNSIIRHQLPYNKLTKKGEEKQLTASYLLTFQETNIENLLHLFRKFSLFIAPNLASQGL